DRRTGRAAAAARERRARHPARRARHAVRDGDVRAHRRPRLRTRDRTGHTARHPGRRRRATGVPRHAREQLVMTTIEPPAAAPVLELHSIHAGYGPIDVLHGVSLAVMPGQVFALLGPNGAGKSTTLAVACASIVPSSGTVFLSGRDVTGAPPDAVARAGVCLIPEGRGIFPNLTVAENLRMATYTGTTYHEVVERACAQFPRLGDRLKQ